MNETEITSARRSRLTPLVVAGVGTLFLAYLLTSLLIDNDWNPTVFLKFGVDSPELVYGERYLEDLILAPELGHDGKYYLIQAADPFYTDPDQHAAYLDRPAYRAQRMVYPTLAGGFGLLSHEAIGWNLLIVSLLAMVAGTYATSRLASSLGVSPWYGLAFALNPGVFIAGILDTAEVVAMAALIFALYFSHQRRPMASAVALTIAVLSRETMLLAAVGLVAFAVFSRRKVDKWMILPFAAPVAWWFYLRLRIGYLTDQLQDTAALAPPFQGFGEALPYWLNNPGNESDLMAAIVLLTISALVVWRTVRNPSFLGFSVAGFALLSIVLSLPVWLAYFDSTRVLAPLITIYLLMVPSQAKLDARAGPGKRDDLVTG